MKIQIISQIPSSGLVVFPLFSDSSLTSEISSLLKNVKKERFDFKIGSTLFFDTGNVKYLIIGLGKKEEYRNENMRRIGGISNRYACAIKEETYSVAMCEMSDSASALSALCEGIVLSSYKSTEFKSKIDDFFFTKVANIFTKGPIENSDKIISKAVILAESQNYSRFLDEKPANVATPKFISEESKRLSKELGFKCTVFEKENLEKMKMGGILAVSQGSANPPALVKLEYNSEKKDLPLYCVIGKGVTFDTGGISLKPSKNMHEMKYDKSGAMNVLGIFHAVSKLKLPIRLLGLMPMVENMPSSTAQRPGDIIKTYGGKTVEVLNTDAEGRLILADTLTYASEHKPQYTIDMATLTGAIIVSLGRFAIGMFSNDDSLASALNVCGEKTHERVWRLPLWPEYGELMKSEFADLKNISELDEAGSITAAAFLREFVGEMKWAHLDIAAVDTIKWPHNYLEKGASGIGVRLVVSTLEELSSKK